MNAEPLLPTVSLVVPCRNERQHIETCVCSLLAQEAPAGGYEVLVVDGMSDDGTRDILTRLARDIPHLRVLDNPARTMPLHMCVVKAPMGNLCNKIQWLSSRLAQNLSVDTTQLIRHSLQRQPLCNELLASIRANSGQEYGFDNVG